MRNTYKLTIGTVTRELPLVWVSEELRIASFVILGDSEIVSEAASLMADKLPEVDFLVTAEAKGIPFAHEVAKLKGMPRYIVARKSVKAYMEEPFVATMTSMTTHKQQKLVLDGHDAAAIRGKRVALIDDVISTGDSLRALEALVTEAGAEIVARAAILAEGDSADREDIIFLEKLPLFPVE
ncbi:phosphoribosyltransferase family protein [Bhargavaea massiliensis]|uniref:phosphoribosyltransferase family protein n=1 Tax=Bhargavaea massiliensis TaxID=2697500 RepID=UPI001BCAE925|nr:phosphoribosyltransferase family protein [Bhargavaea massiliensis]